MASKDKADELRHILQNVDHLKTPDNPEGNPFLPGNLTVDEALEAIQALYAKQQSEAIKEFEDKLNADVLETFTKILLKYGWEYGEDVQHDWTLFRVPNKLLNAYKEDPQHFIAQLTQDTTNTKGGE